MKKSDEIETQIWNYIDGTCSQQDKQIIAGKIKSNPEWTAKYYELQQLSSGLTNMEAQHPSPEFTQHVMQKLAGAKIPQPTKNYFNKFIIRGIASFFIIIIIVGLVEVLGGVSEKTTSFVPDITQNSLNYNIPFNHNVFLVLVAANIILGLALMDKVLRRKLISK